MRIWLVTTGEPLPTDASDCRLLRTGLLADVLTGRDHDVLWWTSTFDHSHKKQRSDRDVTIRVRARYKIRLLRSVGYQHNVSIRRWFDHTQLARRFKDSATAEHVPQIIVCSLPTPQLAIAATRYGKALGVPVVLDVRDLWPDIFLDVLPGWLQPAGRLLVRPMAHVVARACSRASGIIGITPAFVKWGADCAGRSLGPYDRDFPLGYADAVPSLERIHAADRRWDDILGIRDPDDFVICCFASSGRVLDLDSVRRAAILIRPEKRVRFVLCGHFQKLDSDEPWPTNVVCPGWVGSAEIWTLLQRSAAGVIPYRSRFDFRQSIPNKVYEYLSASLPILSSLRGTVESLLRDFDCGYTFDTPAELASAIESLINSPDRRAQMSRNARAIFAARFDANHVYGDLADYLERLVSRHGLHTTAAQHLPPGDNRRLNHNEAHEGPIPGAIHCGDVAKRL